jgi:hypothetical protein
MICRAGKARLKGRGNKGPEVENRRQKGPECNNDIGDRGAIRQLRMRKERTTGKVIRGRRLGSVKILPEALRRTLELEAMKRAVKISSRLQKVSDWKSWRGQSPPTRKKRLHTE